MIFNDIFIILAHQAKSLIQPGLSKNDPKITNLWPQSHDMMKWDFKKCCHWRVQPSSMHDTIFGTIGAIPHEADHIFGHFGSIFGCGTVLLGSLIQPGSSRKSPKMNEKWPQGHDMMIWKLKNRYTWRVSKSWPRISSFFKRSDQYLMSQLQFFFRFEKKIKISLSPRIQAALT